MARGQKRRREAPALTPGPTQNGPMGFALVPLGDSGQVSAYRPAAHVKPQQQGMVARLLGRFLSALRRRDPSDTSEIGSSAAAAPSTFQLTLLQQRYERRAIIADCRQMQEDDPRARKAIKMFAREACRGQFSIMVSKKGARGPAGQRYSRADQCGKTVKKLFSQAFLEGCADMLVTEGDLFVQAVTDADGKELIGLVRMPTTGMERLTNDADQFTDPHRAFEQVDVMTNETVASFSLWQIHHQRWDWAPGERYGRSEVRSVRRASRLLRIQEEAQGVRRMTRAPKRTLWNVGTADKPQGPTEVKQFKEDNGWVEGRREVWDPSNVAMDYFANGLISAEDVGGDGSVADIDDIRFTQDVMVSGLPTPKAVMGLDAESVNRDVLDDQRAEWLKQTVPLSDAMKEVVCWAMDLSLLLAGILPETVDYEVAFSTSSIEKPGEILANVIDAYEVGLLPLPIAVQKIADVFDLDDPDEVIAMLQAEQAKKQQQALGLLPLPTEGTNIGSVGPPLMPKTPPAAGATPAAAAPPATRLSARNTARGARAAGTVGARRSAGRDAYATGPISVAR